MWKKAPSSNQIVRCAIYTRKSTAIDLDMEVNSLQTQREVCQAYIKCQAHRRWTEVAHQYDDGGQSGGNLERPALLNLIADVEAGRVDIIVIYKIDRLTRSLLDFVRLIDLMDRYGVSFVSVTQTFDMSDSMGRLVLNILLTFAQFERELMSDRVRDKKAAMRRKGIFAGGLPPMGYLIKNGHLVVDPDRAGLIKEIFHRYPLVSSANVLVRELRAKGHLTRQWISKNGRAHGGQPIVNQTIQQILTNPIYLGYIVHRGEWIKAESESLITRAEWDEVQEALARRMPQRRDPNLHLLLGILYDEHGRRMKIQNSGPGRGCDQRWYKTAHADWTRKTKGKHAFVHAEKIEELVLCVIKDLLIDRIRLKKMVLSLGLYSEEIARLLKKGQQAARRVALMDRPQIRKLFIALVPRAEVTRDKLKLLVSCHELSRFLAWDGIGMFERSELTSRQGADRVETIIAPAILFAKEPMFALPIKPCDNPDAHPNRSLTALLDRGAELRAAVMADRSRSVGQLAKEFKIGQSYFARLMRLNYLAPDIQAAIYDGTQPRTLMPRDILFGTMPLDWGHQRQLLGFSVP